MDYVGQIIRPPSEANSIILQVTVGCSHNKCTFCGAYKEKTFGVKDGATIAADLDFAARYCRRQHRVFLADGDALILPFPRLVALLRQIREKLPQVRRVSLYGSARAIRSKSVEQLVALKELGLHRIFLGLESGCSDILAQVRKGESAESMIAAARTVNQAGLFLSATVLLGLGGILDSERHARETAAVLNRMAPRQIAALTLMPLDNTPLGHHYRNGEFLMPDARGLLAELRILLENISIPAQFHANHASNYLPISGRLPKDRQKLLDMIDQAREGQRRLVDETSRRL